MRHFDLCVIGAGPSGYAAAMRAVDFNKKVILIDKAVVGGAGITNGALSSKTWWEISRQVVAMRRRTGELNMEMPEIDYGGIKADVQKAVDHRIDLLTEQIKLISQDKDGLLSFVNGNAKLISNTQIQIEIEGATHTFEADYIILAAGSRPRKLSHIPIDEKIILTSDGIGALTEFPESMVVLGAGVIGCEYTTIFSGFGETKVNLIDKGDRILPFEDEDIVEVIEGVMEDKGVHIHRNSKLTRMGIVDGRVEYELEFDDGTTKIFNVEKALVSVGRVPNYENMGLEELGIEMDGRGIKDKATRTSIENIYAVGDITSDIALVNVGELEGRHAVERIFGTPLKELVYENISTIMFLDPEVAGVGLNEIQAQQKGINYKVASIGYNFIARAVANRDTRGFIKLLVTDDDEMRLLGMRVVGLGAAATIQAVALLISMNKGIEELAECVHPHPSISEGVQECVRLLLGKSLFKSRFHKAHITCKKYVDGVYSDIVFE